MAFTHKETHLKLRALLLAVAGIPAARAFENVEFTPVEGTPYLEEDYVPATTFSATNRNDGPDTITGLYVVKWYDVTNAGIGTLHDGADAVLAAYPAGHSFVMASGLPLRIQGSPGPWAGQIIPLDGGFAMCPITIPWRVDVS